MDVAGFGSIATSSYDTAIPTAETAYHHRDHLGGTHVDTDSSGSSLEYVLYEPFGRSLADWKSGGYENDRKFTGKELDQDTGWHYYGSRYYASVEGSFLSEDPVFLELGSSTGTTSQLRDPQLWNSYAYARNNPVRMTDPDGEAFQDQLNRANSVISFVGDLLTFGTFSNAIDNAAAAGDRMAAENGSLSSVANAAYQVAAGTVTAGGSALMTGITAGEGYVGVRGLFSGGEVAAKAATGIAKNGETAATSLGRQMHKEWNYGKNFIKEYRLPNGQRADAVNEITREVIELKPNNPQAINRGVKQVEGYRQQLEASKGGQWKGTVETYNK